MCPPSPYAAPCSAPVRRAFGRVLFRQRSADSGILPKRYRRAMSSFGVPPNRQRGKTSPRIQPWRHLPPLTGEIRQVPLATPRFGVVARMGLGQEKFMDLGAPLPQPAAPREGSRPPSPGVEVLRRVHAGQRGRPASGRQALHHRAAGPAARLRRPTRVAGNHDLWLASGRLPAVLPAIRPPHGGSDQALHDLLPVGTAGARPRAAPAGLTSRTGTRPLACRERHSRSPFPQKVREAQAETRFLNPWKSGHSSWLLSGTTPGCKTSLA